MLVHFSFSSICATVLSPSAVVLASSASVVSETNEVASSDYLGWHKQYSFNLSRVENVLRDFVKSRTSNLWLEVRIDPDVPILTLMNTVHISAFRSEGMCMVMDSFVLLRRKPKCWISILVTLR